MFRTPKKYASQQITESKMICNVCSVETNNQKTIACDVCSEYSHISCIGMKVKTFQNLVSNEKSVWLCSKCQTELKQSESKDEVHVSNNVSKSEILEMFKTANEELMEKVMGNVNNLQLQITNVAESTTEKINAVSEKIDQKFEDINAELIHLKRKNVDDLQQNVSEMMPLIQERLQLDNLKCKTSSNISALETAMDKMERQNHANNLVLDGIPFSSQENVYHLVYDIADKLNVHINEHDINAVFRMKSKRKNASIIVCFQSKYVRDRIYGSYMNKIVKLADIGFRGMTGRIYLNEHLTQKYAELFRFTRELKQKNLIHKSYTLNGIPYVVHKADGKSEKILTANDLSKYESTVEIVEQQAGSCSGKGGG